MNKPLPLYSGNSAYCYSNSLRMCLEQASITDLPEVGLIECMTGMPFGAMFLQLEQPMLFPNPTPIDPDSGLTRALEILGWTCELWRSNKAESVSPQLREVLDTGPVLLGPLDMGFLPYDPSHEHKHGADHFVVALRLQEERVQIHDPQLYPFAILPLDELVRSLYATDLGYAKQAYTMRFNFKPQHKYTRSAILDGTLRSARELIRDHSTGPVVYGGPNAFTRAAELLRQGATDEFANMLTYFVLPVGARRSIDAVSFLAEVGNMDAANLFIDRAEMLGKTQYYAVHKHWDVVAHSFDELARTETELASCL